MTEEQLKSLIAFQKTLVEQVESVKASVESEEFKELDGLNKDLLITEFNQTNALLGIISVRVGLNIATLQQKREQEQTEVADNEEETSTGTEETVQLATE